MGEYELIMFLNDDKIYVMEVDLEGHTKHVGFQGEEYFRYEKCEDIDDFYKNLTDTYNVDALSELDTNIFLIDCGMKSETKWHLIDKLKDCECLNINSISCLLPILLSKKGLLQVGKQIVVEFLDEKYAYICDDEYHVEELATRGKKAQHLLTLDDFSFIAVWNGNLSKGNNDDSSEKLEEAKQAWEQQKIQLDEKLKELGAACKEWEEKYNQLQAEVQKEIQGKKEAISQEMVKRRRIVETKVSHWNRFIKEEVKSGAIVKVNQKIGAMISSREIGDEQTKILSPRAGKIAWIPLDGDELFTGDFSIGDLPKIVGVVGDEDDNEDDMIKWAKDNIFEGKEDESTEQSTPEWMAQQIFQNVIKKRPF